MVTGVGLFIAPGSSVTIKISEKILWFAGPGREHKDHLVTHNNPYFERTIEFQNRTHSDIVPFDLVAPARLRDNWCFAMSVRIYGTGVGGFGLNSEYDGDWISRSVDGSDSRGSYEKTVQTFFNAPFHQLIPEIYFYVN